MNFIQLGHRVVNLDLVAAAERDGNGGPVTVYFTNTFASPNQPLTWTFENQMEADTLWLKLVPRGQPTYEERGGPYSITDNETTGSIQPGS
jgi:hypothetical protein